MCPNQSNWTISGKIRQTESWIICVHTRQTKGNVAKSVKLTSMWLYQSNWLICVHISQTLNVAKSVALQYQSNWPVHCKISQTILYVAISLKVTRRLQNQSKRLVCSNICQTYPYIAISVNLMITYQTNPYVAISIKLICM